MSEGPQGGVCKEWQRGSCRFGNRCKFRHEGQQRQEMPKTKLCPYGDRCEWGDRCRFAHSEAELRHGHMHNMQQQGPFAMHQHQQHHQQQMGMYPGGPEHSGSAHMMGGSSLPGADSMQRANTAGGGIFPQGSMPASSMMGGGGSGSWLGSQGGGRQLPGPPTDEQETQPGSARAEQAHTATAAAAAGGGGLPTLPSTASTAASGVKPLLAAAGGGSSGGPAREVPYLDRVRAVCALLKIGDAQQLLEGKQDAMRAALAAVKNGQAFKESPFADSVEAYLTPVQ